MSEAKHSIRICIVEDHRIVLAGLIALVSGQPDFRVVASCRTVQEAVEAVRTTPMDLLLLDFVLGPATGLVLLSELAKQNFGGRVLVVAAALSDAEVFQLACCGVAGIVMKADSHETLLSAIRKVACGELWYSQHDLENILARTAELSNEHRSESFTPREKAVLRYILDGLTNKEIASRIGSRESSVKSLLQSLFSKAGVRSRGQLVRVALERFHGEF